MPAKKKNSEIVDFPDPAGEQIPESSPPPVARQHHRVVTTYEKTIPLQEIEPSPAEEEEPLIEYFAPPVEIPENADPIAEMFRDLQIEKRSHSWTMVIERLVNFEKDGRFDAGSKRVNCGTRPVTPDFVEEIRREFARPGRPNHFRVLIKRDGKIFAHWPEALSLEPPPVEEIIAEDARHAGSAPSPFLMGAPDPSKQFKQMLDQMRQLAELRAVLFPDQPAAAPIQNPAPLTEEAALLKLLAADSDVVDRVSRQISKRLFSSNPEPETSWPAVLAAGLQYLPTILQQLGFRPPETAAPAGPQLVPPRQPVPLPSPAPPAADPPPAVENGPTPELTLLGRVLQYCADQVPPEGAAAWVDGFTNQNPTVAPLVDLFLAMSPADCLAFLRSYFPAAAGIVEAPHAPAWIQRLQAALSAEPEQPGEVVS